MEEIGDPNGWGGTNGGYGNEILLAECAEVPPGNRVDPGMDKKSQELTRMNKNSEVQGLQEHLLAEEVKHAEARD
jgi:hypothetical protein